MFILCAYKNKLDVRQREPVTSGSVNVYTVRFEFSEDWDGMERIAVFSAGRRSASVLLEAANECSIPWEVLFQPSVKLLCGVYGTKNGTVVLPTVRADLGWILTGTEPESTARPATPDLWQQELARKGDRLDYTENGNLGLYAGDDLLSAVPIAGGGGAGGTTDHRLLSHRDEENQHPIKAISGLEEELDRIPEPVEAITNSELEALLK